MRIDPTRVNELIRSIAEKKIDPDSAARLLLGINSAILPTPETVSPTTIPDSPNFTSFPRLGSPPDTESMMALVQRLGPPPPEVEEDWKRQIESIARSWQARENRPLPPLSIADWLVDSENRVSLSPKIAATADHQPSPLSSPETHRAIEPANASFSFPTSNPNAKQSHFRKPRRVNGPVVVASIAAIMMLLLLLFANSRQSVPYDSSSSSEQTTSPAHTSHSPSPFEPGFIAESPPAIDESVELQAGVMALADTVTPPTQSASVQPLLPDFGFDNPLLGGFYTSGADQSDPTTTPASALPLDRQTENSTTTWDSIAADQPESDSAAIEDQPVESAMPRQAVTLPPLRPISTKVETATTAQVDNSTVVGVNLIRLAQWDHPNLTNVRFAPLRKTGDESIGLAEGWSWIDATSDLGLATLQQFDDQLLFRWSQQAVSIPLSRQIAAGRLRLTDSTGQSSTVFLRPHLRTAPLRLDATETEVRLNWPLEGPAIYQTPSLNLDATKPETADISWVEPPDPTNIRKQIATLQWTPAGKPSPAIRCRIECKATTKLQMRLRYFAQLDSTFPWQPYSATQLTTALDQVTQLLERRTAELSQLERHYQNATTSDRRSIRPLKENAEQSLTQLRSVLQKLQQLNVLHSAVAATAHLQLTLTTDWPDGPQTILEIPLPDN